MILRFRYIVCEYFGYKSDIDAGRHDDGVKTKIRARRVAVYYFHINELFTTILLLLLLLLCYRLYNVCRFIHIVI